LIKSRLTATLVWMSIEKGAAMSTQLHAMIAQEHIQEPRLRPRDGGREH
jgi:hypothetical protein